MCAVVIVACILASCLPQRVEVPALLSAPHKAALVHFLDSITVVIHAGDILVLSTRVYKEEDGVSLRELPADEQPG